MTSRCSPYLPAPQNKRRYRYWAWNPPSATSCISRKTTTGVCWRPPWLLLITPGRATPPSTPKAPDLTLVVGSGRSRPSPSPHPTLIPRGEGAPGVGRQAFLRLGMAGRGGGGGRGRSAGTLSSRHLACCLPHTLCIAVSSCFGGVRGTLDYTLSFGKPCVSGGRGEGTRGISRLARYHPIFC